MHIHWATLVAILGLLSNSTYLDRAAISSVRELVKDPAILAGLRAMFAHAQYGFSHMEEAAFVVAAPDGTLSLLRWPATATHDRSFWKGAFPSNAVAIVHTHPNSMPKPSPLDARTAIETGLPVYVMTRSGIVKTLGGITEVVINKPWTLGKHQFPALVERRTPTRHAAASR